MSLPPEIWLRILEFRRMAMYNDAMAYLKKEYAIATMDLEDFLEQLPPHSLYMIRRLTSDMLYKEAKIEWLENEFRDMKPWWRIFDDD
jgi:hypothetical protein